MSVISYTLHKCTKCMHCLRICPTEAITIQNERAIISPKKCINCGQCMDACTNLGLQAKGSTIIDKDNYEKSVLLVPTSIYSDCSSLKEVETLNAALDQLGFDEVISLGEYEAAVYAATSDYMKYNDSRLLISSFCPVINRLIELKYPMLLSNILPFDYPAEIAARAIRAKHSDTDKLGIFLFCECPSKLTLAKYPYGKQSAIDHALSIVDLFPQINHVRNDERKPMVLYDEAIKSVVSGLNMQVNNQMLAVDGLDKIKKVLELAEFGLLKEVKYLSLSACSNGCIGGKFIWGNPFNGKVNMTRLLKVAEPMMKKFKIADLYGEETNSNIESMPNIFAQLAKFKSVNEQLEVLPGFDCGACGFPSCRTMAEEIVDGRKTLHDCKILGKRDDV